MNATGFGVCLCLLAASQGVAQTGATAKPDAASARAKRERDRKMPEVVQAIGLREGARVADIGAGDGDWEPLLSSAAGKFGRVYAEDIGENSIRRLNDLVKEDGLLNVEVIHGDPDDPKLPANLDAVLMVITYHEIADHETMLRHVAVALKPGGRLVVVDMAPQRTAHRPRADQVKNHVIAPGLVEAEVRAAGFEVASRDDHFIDRPDEESSRWIIVFRKLAE